LFFAPIFALQHFQLQARKTNSTAFCSCHCSCQRLFFPKKPPNPTQAATAVVQPLLSPLLQLTHITPASRSENGLKLFSKKFATCLANGRS